MIQDSFASLTSRIPEGYRNATYQWVCSRRGRITIASGLLVTTLLVLLSSTSTETISSYGHISNYYSGWHAQPSSYTGQSPILTPSKTTLELESGGLSMVPSSLKKNNPSFHVLIPNPDNNIYFCKATLSGMLLNYPPPTLIDGFDTFGKEQERQTAKIRDTHELLARKNIKDDDLVLIVDGNDLWFQLPSDVLIRQYDAMIYEANTQLEKQYGANSKSKYRQTTIWGALKKCPDALKDEPACQAVPESPLPKDIYGASTDTDPKGIYNRPRFLNSGAVIGPAKDLRAIFERAKDLVETYEKAHANDKDDQKKTYTYHMALSSVFGEQEYARAVSTSTGAPTSWHEWLSNKLGHQDHSHDNDKVADWRLDPKRNYEFSIGVDYASTLFQATTFAAPDEIKSIRYDQDASKAPPFPAPLAETRPPFANQSQTNSLSPNKKHLPYIIELEHKDELDTLPDSSTTYANLSLFVNTINPSLPVALFVGDENPNTNKQRDLKLDLWNELWFSKVSRALLRQYLRSASQGVLSFHNAAVGGDRNWDIRGGAGGVWTSRGHWLEWGVEICKGEAQEIFVDNKGEWLKESKRDVQNVKREVETEDHRIRKRDMYEGVLIR